MLKNKDNFRFFVPLDIIKSKEKDKDGNTVMSIKGIASTKDEDSDGEVLDPSGFDLSFFKKSGFINWHHTWKEKPSAVIGEPTKAEIRPEGLYVEGELYNDSKLAHEVYELAETLEKSKSGRRLGFSIEGKATERGSEDENNPLYKIIKKAKITGLAITPTPKNASTLVDIIKGNYSDVETEIEPDLLANGGSTYIIDIVKPNGDRLIVDENYNIKVLSKATDTTDARALIPADVEGKLKDLKNFSKKNKQDKEKNTKFVTLNKSIIFDEILKATNDFDLTKKIVNSINLNNMKKEIKIDELTKALQAIGVEVDSSLLKSEDDIKKAEELEKAEAEKMKVGEGLLKPEEIKKAEEEKAAKEKEEKEKKDKKEPDADDEEEIEKCIKAKEKEIDILKAKRKKPIEKAEEPEKEGKEKLTKKMKKKMFGIEKAMKNELSSTKENISELSSLVKSFAESIDSRLKVIETAPLGMKSRLTAKVIEKSFGNPGDENNKGKTVLSLSKNRPQISNILSAKSGIEKGELNNFYANEMMSLEATGSLSKSMIADLYTNSNIIVTE
jgi:hypothetical protein